MIKLSNGITLPSVVQAPMADCTDLPFRLIAREFGMKFAFMEMISSEALVRKAPKTELLMQTVEADRPVGTQIVGNKPEVMGEAAAKIEALGMDVVDMNLGCPVPKIVCNGGGSQLLRDPEMAGKIFDRVVRSVRRVPVTVKVRLGFEDATGAEAAKIAKIAEDCGVQSVAVHGRTRVQGYKGVADYEAIGRVKQAVNIPVIGNGDVVDAESALRLKRISGCDAVMVGRGALGNPWLYREIEAAFNGEPAPPKPALEERKRVVLKHIDLEMQYNPRAIGPLRRIVCWYFKDFPGAARFRNIIHLAPNVEAMKEAVHSFEPFEDPLADTPEK